MKYMNKVTFITIIYPIIALVFVAFISIVAVSASSDNSNQKVVDESIYTLGDIVQYDEDTGVYYSNNLIDVLDKEILVCGFLIKEGESNSQYKLVNVPYLTTYQGLGKYGVIAVNIKGNIEYNNEDVVLCRCRLNKDENNDMYLDCIEQDEYSLVKSTKMDEYREFMLSGDFNNLAKQIQDIQKVPSISENDRKESIKSIKMLREKLTNNFYNNNKNIIDTIDKLALVYANPELISRLDDDGISIYKAKLVDKIMKDILTWGII